MKIYTKTGDTGQTSLVGGKRVSKCSPRLEAYGTVDELNSHLGLLYSAMEGIDDESKAFLRSIQNRLFNLGAYLATEQTASTGEPPIPAGITADEIHRMEAEIDRLDATLPPLRYFILPGGTAASSQANIARTVCRRAERRVIALAESTAATPIHPFAISYLNRLSDYLFTLGRHINHISGTTEIPWQN